MSDMDGSQGGPMISRPERSGNIGLLIGLALLLVLFHVLAELVHALLEFHFLILSGLV